MFACIPPFETVIDAHQGINFKPTEIHKFVPAGTDEEADEVTINGGSPQKIERGIQIEEDKIIALKFNGKIKIQSLSSHASSQYGMKRKSVGKIKI
ncbi:hypothetical protein AVEN_76879-1 [Araneus ventricosus]|uniref:Uncharacterized protein n=1 Tax=Araneus ventricosus TaxID=182803 RepID=A0A4Y2PZK0_ARAVE|nr:hypothetical protein AVEN_76879-1 [Araneus ventricosus]